ncbi:Isopentenyl-diphosphate delta-isomerase [Candidatus Gugararchaeum adminiculabundum]|nr:Isopentenyl-diphosphate delta-isomerase [Candidatus Gugararchaeum adminiculabundum]
MASTIERRKEEHVKLVSESDVEYENVKPGFADVEILPLANRKRLDVSKINIETKLLGKKLRAPIEIEAMTGGYDEGGRINEELAQVAEKFGFAFCLGSQRAMIEQPELAETYMVRRVAPKTLVFGNIGYANLKEYDVKILNEALKKIGADALYIHLNPQQEEFQPEGNRVKLEKAFAEIKRVARGLKYPVAVKETGAGIELEVAKKLVASGVKIINVAGAGGTSWGRVEIVRGNGRGDYEKGVFPTVDCIVSCAQLRKKGVKLIASGGVRNGRDVAKAIALGADLAGLAKPFLHAYNENKLELFCRGIVGGLREEMARVGAKNLNDLQKCKVRISGATAKRLNKKKNGVRMKLDERVELV